MRHLSGFGLILATLTLVGCAPANNPDGGQPADGGQPDAGIASDGGTSEAPGNSLSGSLAFDVTTSLFFPSEATCSNCGAPAATAFVLANQNVIAAACTADAGVPARTQLINVEVVAPGYVACPNSGAADLPALTPGTYPILDEMVDDEDVCGNIPSTTQNALAILMVEDCATGQGECDTLGWAESGSVTLTSVSSTGVAGSFDVMVGDDSFPDGGAPTELTGTFDTTSACP